MIVFFKDIFTKEECKYLSDILLSNFKEKKLFHEINNGYCGNSYGSTLKEFEDILFKLTPLIKEKTSIKNIKEENSYSRIYFNNSILGSHKDREGLDLTLTTCIFNNTNINWPLFVDFENKIHQVVTNIGDGVLISGTKLNHWRNKLICENDKMIMQCFFHWKILN